MSPAPRLAPAFTSLSLGVTLFAVGCDEGATRRSAAERPPQAEPGESVTLYWNEPDGQIRSKRITRAEAWAIVTGESGKLGVQARATRGTVETVRSPETYASECPNSWSSNEGHTVLASGHFFQGDLFCAATDGIAGLTGVPLPFVPRSILSHRDFATLLCRTAEECYRLECGLGVGVADFYPAGEASSVVAVPDDVLFVNVGPRGSC